MSNDALWTPFALSCAAFFRGLLVSRASNCCGASKLVESAARKFHNALRQLRLNHCTKRSLCKCQAVGLGRSPIFVIFPRPSSFARSSTFARSSSLCSSSILPWVSLLSRSSFFHRSPSFNRPPSCPWRFALAQSSSLPLQLLLLSPFLKPPLQNHLLPIPALTLLQPLPLLRRRDPLALQDPAHGLRTDPELLSEERRSERLGRLRVHRAQPLYGLSGYLVRRRPAFGEGFLERRAVRGVLSWGGRFWRFPAEWVQVGRGRAVAIIVVVYL